MTTPVTTATGLAAGAADPSTAKGAPDAAERRTREPRANRTPWTAGRVILTVALVGFGLLFLYPFAWLLAASLKGRGPGLRQLPVAGRVPLGQLRPGLGGAPARQLDGQLDRDRRARRGDRRGVVVARRVGGFAHFRFPGRGFLFGLVLATMMLPGAVTMIPVYLIWKELGFLGTWVPPLFGGEPVRVGVLHLPAAAVLPRPAA